MNEKKLYEIFARVFDISINLLSDDSDPKSIKQWDSFSGYVLLDEIETEFNINISMEDAIQIKNLGDFKKILQLKGISFD